MKVTLLSYLWLQPLQTNNHNMNQQQSTDPLHGKTLEMIVTKLVDMYGWNELGNIIRINCFNDNPSIKSSLTFLRKTPWARKKVEELYING
jgi:uncharacterized protein (DUF2132 family)